MYADNNKGIFDFKCLGNETVSQFLKLLQEPEVQSFLKLFCDNSLATSELKVLKRLSTIESMLGLNDIEDEQQTIPEQLNLLAERIDNLTNCQCSGSITCGEPAMVPKTKTEYRAYGLVEHLRSNVKGFFNGKEITEFLTNGLPEPYKPKTVNLRQTKKEVLAKVKELFPDIRQNKSEHGNRSVRLVIDSNSHKRKMNTG